LVDHFVLGWVEFRLRPAPLYFEAKGSLV